MWKDGLYKILAQDSNTGKINVLLELNPDHEIFKGHFPGAPVMPGVCMMQMVKETMEADTGTTLLLSRADVMKFLAVVDPGVNPVLKMVLTYKLNGDFTDVVATLYAGDKMCFKFKGTFVAYNEKGDSGVV